NDSGSNEKDSLPTSPSARHQPHRSTVHPDTRLVRACELPRAARRELWPAPPEVLRRRHVRREAEGLTGRAGLSRRRGGGPRAEAHPCAETRRLTRAGAEAS